MSDEATRITQKPAREGEWAAEMRAQLEDMRGQVDAAVAERDAALDEIVRTVNEHEKRRDALAAERDAAVKALRAVEGMLWEARDEASSGKTANASFIDNRVENALAAARAALSEVQR